ncbi:MAG: thiolase family protein [Neomegalonema sp.]|nr:thiolase family protein [Neomegalonema sp.]
MRPVYLRAARRTMVAPRGGAFAAIEAWELGAAVIRAALADAAAAPGAVEAVLMGNGLYGGGNPARLAALAAGAPDWVPAMTLDTQCCSGLDAIALAAERARCGAGDVFLAGGLESFSRAPIRLRRPKPGEPGEAVAYQRPPFAPSPEFDPDPGDATAALAQAQGFLEPAQHAYAIESHRKARAAAARMGAEIAPIADRAGPAPAYADPFTRKLTEGLCRRSRGAATTAVEADAAAVIALSATPPAQGPVIRFLGAVQAAGDTRAPASGAVLATRKLLAQLQLRVSDLAVVELMEAYAAQAMAWIDAMDAPAERVNRGGGALARGHPIGASGAVLAVRLYHELAREADRAVGLAAIPAVGGLGAAIALQVGEPA